MWAVIAALMLCGMVFGEDVKVKHSPKLGYDIVEIKGEVYHTGYKPRPKDPRRPIFQFPRHLGYYAEEDLPLQYDLRPYALPAGRQLCGDCWCWGGKQAFQTILGFLDKVSVDISAQWCIDCSGFGTCNGGNIWVSRLVDMGAVHTADYPYVGRTQRCNKNATFFEKAKATGSVKLTTDDIRRAAFEHGALEVCGSAGALGNGGVVSNPGGGSTNHCYAYLGWLDGKTQGWDDGIYHIILNSWGLKWGKDGYGYYRDNGRIFRGIITEAAFIDYKPKCEPQAVADAGAEMWITLDPSLPGSAKLGTPAVAGMTYSWSPEAGLDDPTKAQPIYTPPAGAKTSTFAVKVTSPCSVAQSSVIVHVLRPVMTSDGKSILREAR